MPDIIQNKVSFYASQSVFPQLSHFGSISNELVTLRELIMIVFSVLSHSSTSFSFPKFGRSLTTQYYHYWEKKIVDGERISRGWAFTLRPSPYNGKL